MGALGSLAEWVLAAVATLGGLAGVVKRNRDRSITNKRQLRGDPDDPNTDGVLQIAHENGQKLDALEAKMEGQHDELMERMDDLHGTTPADDD